MASRLAILAMLMCVPFHSPLRADKLDDAVNFAIDRGFAALRTKQAADGSFGTYGTGSTSLVCIALMECGLPASDPIIQKAIAYVRTESIKVCDVYHLALDVIFLDKVGDAKDVPLIQGLAVRLLEGQLAMGAWSYLTPYVTEAEKTKLQAMLEQRELKTAPDSTKAPRTLDPDLQARIENIPRNVREREQEILDAKRLPNLQYDNSNTQFAIMGLWIGRRHGVPVESALARCEAHFRATQENATWPYRTGFEIHGRMAMTCAGLLGIAASTASHREKVLRTDSEMTRTSGKPPALREPLKDLMVQQAINFLGREMVAAGQGGLAHRSGTDRDLYALWSVERVGMVYSLSLMGGVNWYRVGSQAIVQSQLPSGLWKCRYTEEVDTSFALLFLRRASLLPDMSTALRAKPEPTASTTLKASGESPTAAKPTDPIGDLVREINAATPARRSELIGNLRDTKGTENTDRLAAIIPSLAADAQKQARDALAERLSRMTADTIRQKLKDTNAEIRRGAAVAAAVKEDSKLIPDLISALDDKDPWVVRATGVALRQLTGQDFGPKAEASADDRAKAVAAWKSWWRNRKQQ